MGLQVIPLKLAIFGPPGSGKGTYSSRLERELNVEHISTGKLLRESIERKDETGKRVKGYLESGELVPDSIVNNMVKRKLKEIDMDGFILDGYPRTVDQAEFLLDLVDLDAVVFLKIHEEIIVKKLLGRRVCEKCGKNYNISDIHKEKDGVGYELPPLTPDKDMECDSCGGDVIERHDDTERTIRKRIQDYNERKKPLKDFFDNRTETVEVWSDSIPSVVTEKIVEKLRKFH